MHQKKRVVDQEIVTSVVRVLKQVTSCKHYVCQETKIDFSYRDKKENDILERVLARVTKHKRQSQ